MRMSATARFRARSSAREVMRLILTPAMGCTSYRVTAGPREISSTRVLDPELSSVSHQLLGVGLQLGGGSLVGVLGGFVKQLDGGYS